MPESSSLRKVVDLQRFGDLAKKRAHLQALELGVLALAFVTRRVNEHAADTSLYYRFGGEKLGNQTGWQLLISHKSF